MILSASKNSYIDPVVNHVIKNFDSDDVVLISITKHHDFEFNDGLYNIDKEWMLFDFVEYGWCWDRKETHLFGKNTDKFNFVGDEWKKFDEFVSKKPPVIYFKRELLLKDKTDTILPIEYPAFHSLPPIESEEQFYKRPLQVYHSFGHSHECRRILHGDTFRLANKFGYFVIDNFNSIHNTLRYEQGDIWASIFVPHFNRFPMDVVLGWNNKSKISVSMEGAGIKCFRSTGEAPFGSIMAIRQNELAWTYEWNNDNAIIIPCGNDINSIKGLDQSNTVEFLYQQSKRTDLYKVYLNSQYTLEKYHIINYSKHIKEIICSTK